ncbi:MAG: PD-(D/E)XK nuclease family protein [Erythrobacter sp.]|jgi:hypothetical protein|nr:PD-(D/E)XK nuclease family protein [Erythrobacter sp.]
MVDGTSSAPTTEELESLFVNNELMSRIEAHLNRFNPIRVMKMERMEIRHSAILSWLLDPAESHGLDDKFLKAFLAEALRGKSLVGSPSALDIARADLRDAIVRREWQNIDIFIHSERNGWAFVVENKYDSKQHEGQLTKYLEKVPAGLGKQPDEVTVRGIFLTLHDEEPEDDRYAPIDYEAICRFLPRFLSQEAHLLTAEVKTFLQHYIEIIAEEVGMSAESSEMEKLARQLYRENKKVLDFIMDHGSGSDFAIAAEDLFGDDRDYLDAVTIEDQTVRFNHIDHKMVSFLPESWYIALGKDKYDWKGCEKWWAGYPLIVWMQLWPDADGTSGQLALYGEVGPLSEYEFRRDLIHAIQKAAAKLSKNRIMFQRAAADEGKQYSKFLKENFLKIKDVQDAEEISAGMKKLLKKFQPELDAVGSVLPKFVKYGYEE